MAAVVFRRGWGDGGGGDGVAVVGGVHGGRRLDEGGSAVPMGWGWKLYVPELVGIIYERNKDPSMLMNLKGILIEGFDNGSFSDATYHIHL
ncbi:hypothetical protein Tco_0961738 [Tanacetum coccineum]